MVQATAKYIKYGYQSDSAGHLPKNKIFALSTPQFLKVHPYCKHGDVETCLRPIRSTTACFDSELQLQPFTKQLFAVGRNDFGDVLYLYTGAPLRKSVLQLIESLRGKADAYGPGPIFERWALKQPWRN